MYLTQWKKFNQFVIDNINEIDTKLLITDGDIVVIGGIKIDRASSVSNKTPGLSKVPVVGNLFKNNTKEDELDEMLIFISPRVVD